MRILAVIFDMDGLMLDTERLSQSAYSEAAAALGLDFPAETYLHLIGRPIRESHAILRGLLPEGFPVERLAHKANELYTARIASGQIPHKRGLTAMLDFVEAQGLRLGVATSTARPLALKKLEMAGILHRFAAVTCGDEVDRGKPCPDIYLEAARRLDVAPGACLALEDSFAGVRAAHAAGMRAIMVPDIVPATDEIGALAHAIVESLEEAVHVIRRTVGGG